jgi:hypothetical protein
VEDDLEDDRRSILGLALSIIEEAKLLLELIVRTIPPVGLSPSLLPSSFFPKAILGEGGGSAFPALSRLARFSRFSLGVMPSLGAAVDATLIDSRRLCPGTPSNADDVVADGVEEQTESRRRC